ncbi:MAG: hypothetical protein JSW58_15085 [Candidatus Latescibacterota bacterium]|nr:MAG: hypothetical protein JSW58_15085 [Candidatus Latescibacterota bacterium]
MRKGIQLVCRYAAAVLVTLTIFASGCQKSEIPRDVNLLTNPSFEEVEGGLPVGWEVRPFRGIEPAKAAEFGIDESYPHDGDRAVFFKADPDAQRFFMLSQEVEVTDITRIRLRGAVRSLDVRRNAGQYPQANFALTFLNKDRGRTYSARFYDQRTRPRLETSDDWIVEDRIFRLPVDTKYVVVHCVLGMGGTIWFDDVSLEVPTGLGWQETESKNFTFHWLPGSEYPEGSQAYQQQLFDNYATRLGIPESDRPKISHYFYPDSLTMYEAIGVKVPKKAYWDSREVHSIFPVDDHEIVHILTKPYGTLTFGLTEGTAFYLIGHWKNQRIVELAHDLLEDDRLPSVQSIVVPFEMKRQNPDIVGPAAAAFVGFLIEYAGPERFLELHRQANDTGSYEEFRTAFENVYGRSVEDAEAAFRKILAEMTFAPPDSTSPGQQLPDSVAPDRQQ